MRPELKVYRLLSAGKDDECCHIHASLSMQALQNIRTVVAYVGEEQTCKQYNAALAKPHEGASARLVTPYM